MRYDIDENNYITNVYFNCYSGTCVAYTGSIPSDYNSLEEWEETESKENRLNAWEIVEGNLVFDNAKYSELQAIYEQEEKDYSNVIHKELEPITNAIEIVSNTNNQQYQKETSNGKVFKINNVKSSNVSMELNQINPYEYSKIDVIVNGLNILPNTATSQTIDGIDFEQNEDRTITINGTSTDNIEYNIAGTSNNRVPFLVLKKNEEYYLNTNGFTLKMYFYDGTDRTEIYGGTGGSISFTDSDKLITQIVLYIPNETTIDNETISPQLELGDTASDYETYKSKKITIDFSKYLNGDSPVFPNDDVIGHAALKSGTTKSGIFKALSNVQSTTAIYPSETLFPVGNAIDYIKIENGKILIKIDGKEKNINDGYISTFDGINTIYAFQNANIEIEYCINNLALEGTTTKNNNFKILEDGSIEATNGKFTGGIINLTSSNTSPKFSIVGGGNFEGKSSEFNSGFFSLNDDDVSSKYEADDIDIIDSDNKELRLGLNNLESYIDLKCPNSNTSIEIFAVETNGGNPTIKVSRGSSFSSITQNGMWSPSFNNTSLENTKKNFSLLNNALDIVNDTDIYEYNLKSQNDEDKKHIGLVIGDKYNYSGKLTNEQNDAVDIYAMVSVCFKAIQEQQKIIEELQNKLKESEK